MRRAGRHRRFPVLAAAGMVVLAVRVLCAQGGADLAARVRSASALEKAGRWAEAREAWLSLGAGHPRDRRVQFGLERVYRHVDDDGRYLAWLRENVERSPGDFVLFRQYLAQAVRAGELDGLEGAIRRHLAAGPGSEAFYRDLAAQLGRLNLADRAEAVLRAGRLEANDPTRFARELSDLCFRTGRYAESLEEALNALLRDPGALAFARGRAVEVADEMPGPDRLALVASFAEGVGRGMPCFLRLLAGLQADAGDGGAALATLRRLATLDPDAAVREIEAFAERQEGDGALTEAMEARRLLVRVEPGRRSVHELQVARLYRAMGRPKRALETYRRLLAAGPEAGLRDGILLALGLTELYDRGRPAEAIAWLERIDRMSADSELVVDAAIGLAVARACGDDPEGAAREAERAAALPPPADRAIEVAFVEAETEIAAGHPDRGRALLARVARRRGHPLSNDAVEMMLWLERDGDADGEVARGLVLQRLTSSVIDGKRSIRRLESIRKRCGECDLAAETRLELAGEYRAADRAADAIAALESILSDFPDHRLVPRAEWTLAEIQREIGQPERARAHLERILRQFGSSVYAPRARRAIEAMDRPGEPLSRRPSGPGGAGVGRGRVAG